ncbi:MAG: hypothetical protein GYA72_02615 [Deltaproteobacteria bacterium]|jgi:hypothetical protein|nr:hypothetical protein [Deltaproteobacteria bacterium]
MMSILIRLFIIFFVICAYGCAVTPDYFRYLESRGTIKIDIVDNDSYDYRVWIDNKVDFTWDGGNREDRLKAVNRIFEAECREVHVIDETPLKRGKYVTGKEAITWVMKIRCIK